jgi:hypothetical protein
VTPLWRRDVTTGSALWQKRDAVAPFARVAATPGDNFRTYHSDM